MKVQSISNFSSDAFYYDYRVSLNTQDREAERENKDKRQGLKKLQKNWYELVTEAEDYLREKDITACDEGWLFF